MKIRLLSDLHHEFYEDQNLYANKGEHILVVAGDLAVGPENCWSALQRFAEHTRHVVYVPGNHEYYNYSIREFDEYLTQVSYNTNVHFLNPGCVTLDGVTFIGATLWTDFGNSRVNEYACSRSINDFRLIKDFNTGECVRLNARHTKYVRKHAELPGKKVVVTHFLPDHACIAPQYRGPDPNNHYFANNLGSWIQDLEHTVWLFGHTHTVTDIKINNTRVLANPYGYYRNKNYTECVVEV